MDVRLPNGRVIKNVPEGTPKDEIRRKAVAAGLISDSEFPREATPIPVRDEGFRFYQNQAAAAPEEPEAPQGARASVPSEQGLEPYQELTPEQKIVAGARRSVRAVKETASSVGEEVSRSVYGGALVPAAQTLLSLANATREVLGFKVSEEEKAEQQAYFEKEFSIMTGDERRTNSLLSRDERGNVVYARPETVTGALAPYLFAVPAGFSWMVGSKLLRGLNAASKITIATLASDVGVNQLITDPYTDNLVDMLEDAFPDSKAVAPIAAFLATEENDPESVRRLKMMGQDALLSSAFAGTASFIGMLRNIKTPEAKKAVESGINALSDVERGELFYQVLEGAKEGAKAVVRPAMRNGKPVYRNGRPVFEQVKDAEGNPVWRSYEKTEATTTAAATPEQPAPTVPRQLPPEEMRQIEGQAGSALKRMWAQTGTSRGYWTNTLFDMSQKSQSEQRALLSEANHAARRLTVAMDRVARQVAAGGTTLQAASDDIMERVQRAFVSGDPADLNALPDEIKSEVITSRAFIDGLTQRMIDSPSVYEEFKKTLIDGQGKYLRTSYEAYTNPNYVPSASARSGAVDFLTNENLAAGMPLDEAIKLAEGRVVALLGRDGKGLDSYVSDAVKVNNSVYSRTKDIPEEIKTLLGKITNPADNVIQSANKLVNFVQADKFSRDLLEIGDGRFLFDAPQGIYTTPITGTNTVLDVVQQGTETAMPGQAVGRGRYTTPEIATAINGRQVDFIPPGADGIFNATLRSFIAWKGMSQSAKTIYSHTTHFKNLIGASLMRAANGSNPIGSATKAWTAVSNEIGGGVDVAAQKVYEKYLRLGIINTDVRLGDISEMMKTALDNPNGLGDWFVRKADEYNSTLAKGVEAVIDTPRAVYMGTDDFFKIGEFEDYLQVLREAYPNEAIDVLEQRAAKVVRDVLPNYDLVPNAIKQLRVLPFGNFVGFPSEVVRTSTNIIRTSFEEITSGNPVLYARGLRRLTAFGMFGGLGTEGLSDVTKSLAGYSSSEEQDAIDIISRTPWSQDPTVFVVRDSETGELYKADVNSMDPYDFFRAPVKAFMRQIKEGTVSNQELDAMLMEASAGLMSASLKPFLSEALVTEAMINAWTGWTSESGESRDGTRITSPGMSGADSMVETLKIFWETVEPGTFTSARRFLDESSERYKEYTGDPTDPGLAALNQLGLTWAPLSLDKHIEFVAGDYLDAVANSQTLGVDYRATPEDILERYDSINRDRYEAQRVLYEQTEAANTLGLSSYQISTVLKDRGLTEDEVWAISTGQYHPLAISPQTISRIREQVYAEGNNHSMSYEQLIAELRRRRSGYENNSLLKFEDTTEWRQPNPEFEEKLKEGPLSRLLFAVGGVVSVPNAPMFPAARKDKYTGMPYDLQAGGSYVEDNPMARLLRACGGPVRQQKAGGGVVTSGRTHAACSKLLGGNV